MDHVRFNHYADCNRADDTKGGSLKTMSTVNNTKCWKFNGEGISFYVEWAYISHPPSIRIRFLSKGD